MIDIAIIQFPGSNCDRETSLAVARAGMNPVRFLWNESPEILLQCQGYVIVGGFSYEDRSRAGIIAALDPLMAVLKSQGAQGKPILGICNGAQILVESGLVPGLAKDAVHIALTDNKRIAQGQVLGTGYYNEWVYLRVPTPHQTQAFTRCIKDDAVLKVPVAHAEGRFVMSPALLDEIETRGLVVFKYCTEDGSIVDEFPINPNGSINNIAAISNASGHILAIMPHPERTPEGDVLFDSMREYILSSDKPPSVLPLSYRAERVPMRSYLPSNATKELIIELMITDNQARSVENTLRHLGIAVTIKRYTHWAIGCQTEADYEQVLASGILFNDRKEAVVTARSKDATQYWVLVKAKDDVFGLQIQQQLQHDVSIQHGVLWQIGADAESLETAVQQVLASGILYNATSHDGFHYE